MVIEQARVRHDDQRHGQAQGVEDAAGSFERKSSSEQAHESFEELKEIVDTVDAVASGTEGDWEDGFAPWMGVW